MLQIQAWLAEKGRFGSFISRMFARFRAHFLSLEKTLAGKTGLRYSPVRFSIVSTTGYDDPQSQN
jgi:hypothetical protein